jgi:hypothetical protein
MTDEDPPVNFLCCLLLSFGAAAIAMADDKRPPQLLRLDLIGSEKNVLAIQLAGTSPIS